MKTKEKDKKTRPVGHPTTYKPEYCQKLEEHMKLGLSFASFAGVLHVSIETLYDWARKHTEFAEAKKKGNALSLLHWELQGVHAINQHPTHTEKTKFQVNNTMYIYQMKCRFAKYGFNPQADIPEDPDELGFEIVDDKGDKVV